MIKMRSRVQTGFTLIEALVALLVLSIGMLGVAAMQLKALQGAHAAYQRSIASLAAQDAQERLWAELKKESTGKIICPSDISNIQNAWHSQWGDFLPGFSKRSVMSGKTGCVFSIKVDWDEKRFGGSTERFTYTARLPGE